MSESTRQRQWYALISGLRFAISTGGCEGLGAGEWGREEREGVALVVVGGRRAAGGAKGIDQ